MDKVKNSEIIPKLIELSKGKDLILSLNSIDKYVILKFSSGIKEEYPVDIDFKNVKDTTGWIDGVLFNEEFQIKFFRINNKEFLVEKKEIKDYHDKKKISYIILGEKTTVKNNWTLMEEFKIDGYWIPGSYEGKVALEGFEIIDYDKNNIAICTDVIISNFKNIDE